MNTLQLISAISAVVTMLLALFILAVVIWVGRSNRLFMEANCKRIDNLKARVDALEALQGYRWRP